MGAQTADIGTGPLPLAGAGPYGVHRMDDLLRPLATLTLAGSIVAVVVVQTLKDIRAGKRGAVDSPPGSDTRKAHASTCLAAAFMPRGGRVGP